MTAVVRFIAAAVGLCGVGRHTRSPSAAHLSPTSSPASSPRKADSPKMSWELSEDFKCKYPMELYEGLLSVPWRRVVASAHHRPVPRNLHVFLIGKRPEQFAQEHQMSRKCIEHLADFLKPE
mmetsp:Transcript_24177/g.42706  ORF Transcript_24177/g.42706 Transcript_24177/m.42706 type:complete len:122 (-) Transcript_24177:249-614(-)